MSALADIQFLAPVWLTLWPLSVIIIVLLYLRGYLKVEALTATLLGTQRHAYVHPRAATIKQLAEDKAPRKAGASRAWLLVGTLVFVSLVHLSLAQPFRYGQKIPQPPAYRDVVFMVDTSVTMVLRDYRVKGKRVNRLTMLKSVLQHFIDRLSGNRMGIVVFSEQAYTLVPLTTDTGLLNTMLRRLEITLTGRVSDVSKGILYTLNRLQAANGEENNKDRDTRRPLLILVTDVNRPVRDVDPRAAAASAARAGYQLHTIAIGAATEGAVKEDFSSLIYTPANLQLLQEIAENGHGKFFRAENTASLRQAIDTIQSAAARQIQPEPRYVPVALYYWPLGGALAVLTLMQLILLWRRT